MAIDKTLHCYIGWDGREAVASYVAANSIKRRSKANLNIKYLKHRELRKQGYFLRPWHIESSTGDFIDLIDNRKFSTEFSHTRFLVPALMNYQGWALFMDADMIFLSDIKDLFALCDDKYAVMCVHHNHIPPFNCLKMDGREQLRYHRKNWSSFVLFNCSHSSNKILTKEMVSYAKGSDLHSFAWLRDDEIGKIPFSYNYIAGISPTLPKERGNRPDVIHYTDGGPWFDECKNVPYAQTWLDEYEYWQANSDIAVSDVPSMRYEPLDNKLRK